MPKTSNSNKLVGIRILAQGDFNGERIEVMEKQEIHLSKNLHLRLRRPKRETAVEITAEISYANGEPFSENTIKAELEIGGKKQKIKLERIDGNMFKGVLAEPVNIAGQKIELKLEGNYSASDSVNSKKENQTGGLFVIVMAGIFLAGFVVYVFRKVSKSAKPLVTLTEKKPWEKIPKTAKTTIKEIKPLKHSLKTTVRTENTGAKSELKKSYSEGKGRKPKIKVVYATREKQGIKRTLGERKKPIITGALNKNRKKQKPRKPRIKVIEAKL